MHFVTFGSSGSDCEKERAVRTCVRGQGSCFQGKRYQRDLRFFTLDAFCKIVNNCPKLAMWSDVTDSRGEMGRGAELGHVLEILKQAACQCRWAFGCAELMYLPFLLLRREGAQKHGRSFSALLQCGDADPRLNQSYPKSTGSH